MLSCKHSNQSKKREPLKREDHIMLRITLAIVSSHKKYYHNVAGKFYLKCLANAEQRFDSIHKQFAIISMTSFGRQVQC